MEVENTKQVIVVRRDIKMSHGKCCAQVAHASLEAILNEMLFNNNEGMACKQRILYTCRERDPIDIWLSSEFTKITVSVNSEQELLDIYSQVENIKYYESNSSRIRVPRALIQDLGRTEFHGVPTYTCCAIGPWWSEELDKITGALPLL